jgi:crossover junction endodeoxyribonuclease RusA
LIIELGETMLKFTLPYPPSVNHYLGHRGHTVYRTEKANDYREIVGWILNDMEIDPSTNPLVVTIRAFRPRKAGDIDGILKVALDAMNKLAYQDDKQIIELHVFRGDDKHNPRLEVEINEVIA